METVILIMHIFSCLFLIALILVQHSQGSDMGAAFGGASQTVFGSRGPATFMNKLTIVVAVIFLGASLMLANMARKDSAESVIDKANKTSAVDIEKETKPVPVEEAAPPEAAPAEKTTEENKE